VLRLAAYGIGGKGSDNATLPLFFFFPKVLTYPPLRRAMPSKFTVSLVLDKETNELWDNLPIGERSWRVRQALKDANTIEIRDRTIVAVRKQVERHERTLSDIRLLCTCKSIRAYLDEGDSE